MNDLKSGLAVICLAMLLAGCAGAVGNADAGPDPGGGFYDGPNINVADEPQPRRSSACAVHEPGQATPRRALAIDVAIALLVPQPKKAEGTG